jgi:predicted AAA+ superfamily ATPase
MYEKRHIDNVLTEYLNYLPAVLIQGAKGVGKTATSRNFSRTIYSLDLPLTRELVLGDISSALTRDKPIVFDEWQFAPEIWSYVRHAVDDGMTPGSVIFTGSSTQVHKNIHSGAGRIVALTMRPYTVQERHMSDVTISLSDIIAKKVTLRDYTDVEAPSMKAYLDEIFKSGLPGIRQYPDVIRDVQMSGYVDNLLMHEFEENGIEIRRPQLLKAWLEVYATAMATATKYSTLLEAVSSKTGRQMDARTATTYRELLQTFFIIDEVPAFLGLGKVFKNLAKSPKHFLLDPYVATTLLGIKREQFDPANVEKCVGKLGVDFLGQLMESLVYQTLVVYADAHRAQLSHFRDAKGAREIDFILKQGNTLILFEVKADSGVMDKYVRHMNWFEDQVKSEYEVVKILLNTGPRAYTRQDDDVHVIPIGLLGF